MRISISLWFVITGTILVCSGCRGSRTTTINRAARADHPVQSIALNPSGGILADAIGVELVNRGFNVIDTQETSNLLVRMEMGETEFMEPANLAQLRERGIDAILTVRSATNADGMIVNASARLVSAHNSRVLGGVAWENAKSGASGSPADHMAKKGVTSAAKEIVQALLESADLNPPG